MAYEVKKTEHNGAKKVKVFGVRKLMRKNKAIKLAGNNSKKETDKQGFSHYPDR